MDQVLYRLFQAMNIFFEIVAVLLLFFLFWGEPDVWDALHSRAMSVMEPVDCTNQRE